MENNDDSIPAWARWLLIGGCVTLVDLVVLGAAFFLWPWLSVFS